MHVLFKDMRSVFAGQWSEMVISTIDLGISILMGGNTDVQKVGLMISRKILHVLII